MNTKNFLIKRSLSIAKVASIFVSGLAITVGFQNCSNGFQAVQLQSLSSSSITPVCVNGTTQTGYAMASVVSPLTCGQQVTKTCVGGQWDSQATLSATCKQQCVHPSTQQPVDIGTIYTSFVSNQGANQAACDSVTNKIESRCDQSSGLFVPPPAANATCLVQGQVCAYTTGAGIANPTGNAVNSSVTGYASSTAVGPGTCGAPVTRSCQAGGQWTGSTPLYTACAQKCLHPETAQPVDINTSFIYYTLASGSQAQCDAAKKTSVCQQSTGLFAPQVPAATSRFASCGTLLAPTISSFTANTTNLTAGGSVTLSWTTSNATTLTLNPGAMSVTGTGIVLTPAATTTYILTATNASGSVSSSPITVNVSAVLTGLALYNSVCISCHGAFAVSTLKTKIVTSALIKNAISTISAMSTLNLAQTQIDSIVALFSGTVIDGTTPVLTSEFACTTQDEKNSSVQTRRLNAYELVNTYAAVLPAAVYSALSGDISLLPTKTPFGTGAQFIVPYTESNLDRISQFNEKVAAQLTSSNANISAFFGTCATTASFTQTCFNTFMSTLAPKVLRSALTTADSTNFWNAANQGTAATDKLKILAQILFNHPRFLYNIELGEGAVSADGFYTLSSYEVANRVAYGMTSAPPDATLWADAVGNRLKVLATVNTHVDRLALLPAFKNQVIQFAKFYVNRSNAAVPIANSVFLSGVNTTNINTDADQDFTEFINYVLFTSKGTFSDLFTSRAAFPKTQGLASVYGTGTWTTGTAPLTAPNHAGLLSKPFVNIAGSLNNRLVQRGRNIRLSMLCYEVPEPSATDLSQRPNLTDADFVNLTRRQYIDKGTLVASNCIACHSKMNEVGFTTGNYDALGRFTTTERIFDATGTKVAEHAIDTLTKPQITTDDNRMFTDLNDFSTKFTQSNAVQKCLSIKALQFFQWKTENVTYDTCRLNKIDNLIKKNTPLIQVFTENFKQQSVLTKRSNQ